MLYYFARTLRSKSTVLFTLIILVSHNLFAQVPEQAPFVQVSDSVPLFQTETEESHHYFATGYVPSVGASTLIQEKDFNKGLIANFEQLILGRVSGVQNIAHDGAPGGAHDFFIWGRKSLDQRFTALVILDGVQLPQAELVGTRNLFNFISPQNIESIKILKDAAATALYGIQGAGGVIIITSKSASLNKKLSVRLNSTVGVSEVTHRYDVLDTVQFRMYAESLENFKHQWFKDEIGNASTNWQDHLYRTSIGHEHNLQVSSGDILPLSLQLNLTNNPGVVNTSYFKRNSIALRINPSFFKNHLKLDLNIRGSSNNNRFVDNYNVYLIVIGNPTKPTNNPNDSYYDNLLQTLHKHKAQSTVNRGIVSAHISYKMPFLPALQAHVRRSIDLSYGTATNYKPEGYRTVRQRGEYLLETEKASNSQYEYYLTYTFSLPAQTGNMHFTAGRNRQLRNNDKHLRHTNAAGTTLFYESGSNFNYLNSTYFGRIDYNLKGKYAFSYSVSQNAISGFGQFASPLYNSATGISWDIKKEFLETSTAIDEFKIRSSLGKSNSPNLLLPLKKQPKNQLMLLRPEIVKTFNIGADFKIYKERVNGNIDFFYRKTDEVIHRLVEITRQGEYFRYFNYGTLTNKGIDMQLDALLYKKQSVQFSAGLNIIYLNSKVSNLTEGPVRLSSTRQRLGFDPRVQANGYSPFSFSNFKQLYDNNGFPKEGMYADMNKNNRIDWEDRSPVAKPDPSTILGISSSFTYHKLSGGTLVRAHAGNSIYNAFSADFGNLETLGLIDNASTSILHTNFTKTQAYSDYYIENARFVRLENIYLQYELLPSITLTTAIQNALVFTSYSGTDPERHNGIDFPGIPRPRIFSLSASIGF